MGLSTTKECFWYLFIFISEFFNHAILIIFVIFFTTILLNGSRFFFQICITKFSKFWISTDGFLKNRETWSVYAKIGRLTTGFVRPTPAAAGRCKRTCAFFCMRAGLCSSSIRTCACIGSFQHVMDHVCAMDHVCNGSAAFNTQWIMCAMDRQLSTRNGSTRNGSCVRAFSGILRSFRRLLESVQWADPHFEAMADAPASLALFPEEGLEEAPLDAAAIRRCGTPALLSTRIIPRCQTSGSSSLFCPLFVCSLVGGSRVEELALRRMMGISLCTWSLWGWFFSASWTAFRAARTAVSWLFLGQQHLDCF
jgi:hypothetical protein